MTARTARRFTQRASGLVLATLLVAACGSAGSRSWSGVVASAGLVTAVYGTVFLAGCGSTSCRVGTSAVLFVGVDLLVLGVMSSRSHAR